jgi:orotate phosphoribosyltransferase
MINSTLHTPQHQFIITALQLGAIELLPKGRKLRSGRTSFHFFNSGKFEGGQGQALLAEAYALALYHDQHTNQIQAIYGPPYKGIGLAHIVGIELWKRFGIPVGIASSRKEKKDHGEGGIHLGSDLKEKGGKGTCLIDDVMTTGESLDEAHKYVAQCGGFPTVCVIAFDRVERQRYRKISAVEAFEQKHKIPVCSIANVQHLIEVLEIQGHKFAHGQEVLPKIRKYMERYGC